MNPNTCEPGALLDTPEFQAFWRAFVERFDAQEALDCSHMVTFDPRDEDDAIRARRVAREQREKALQRLFAADDALRTARAAFEVLKAPPPPGAGFYVTAIDGEKLAFLAGPFATNVEAAGWVVRARALAFRMDPQMAWARFGTSAASPPVRTGLLNERLGIPAGELLPRA